MPIRLRPSVISLVFISLFAPTGMAAIPAAHVYHNHMPNFWPFYAVDVGARYNSTAVGQPIRYFYDGQVIQLKNSPPANYPYYLPASAGGGIMPHDDLVSYYSHHAKTGAYMSWPMLAASELQAQSARKGQVHVTMTGAVVNNVNDLNTLQNVPGYNNPAWGAAWRTHYQDLTTVNGHKTLDMIHMTGHHSMCPLVGNEYCLKDLIYQNATLAQPYFLGDSYRASKGYFPTELGFSTRTIPVLAKLGISWAVMGNNHFSRTLKDYPFDLYYPNRDTMVSPPNRADQRNTSTVGSWVDQQMAHEQQVIRNKLPFANTPHWVRHVDPATGAVSKVAGIPVDQAGSWLEGWEGSTTVDALTPYAAQGPRQFFVLAHDGDNSQGRSGSLDTWQNGYNVTCTGSGYCLGIDEYLQRFPIPADDVQHVQDGSWIDTRDSSSDPQWHHWRLPFGIWRAQFADMNRVNGTQLEPKRNLDGLVEGMTVSFEYGFHYLERNFALLQAALNHAKTAEQIWLDTHPAWWSPSTARDREITHTGNQLNPWMLSFPVKGDPARDYAGGANPAELAWYFLLPAMDSGFGYYDENKDDHVKGTLAFNNSLYFSKDYVRRNLARDRTGPSVWWPQRWPYNPGSVNADKSQGWTVHHYNNTFALYTYAHDVSSIRSVVAKVRTHARKTIDERDDSYKVYNPAALAGRAGLNITAGNVGPWRSYTLTRRDLRPVMNGVAWNKVNMDTMAVLPAQETGDLYYGYVSDYRDQLLDYYIEATDSRGNITRTDIQQVYVGAGRYNRDGNRWVEAVDGATVGTHPFLQTNPDLTPPTVPGQPVVTTRTATSVSLRWDAASDNVAVSGYDLYRNGELVHSPTAASHVDTGLAPATRYIYEVRARDAAGNVSARSPATSVTTQAGGDRIAPSEPGAPAATVLTSNRVILAWAPSTDNVGVHHYYVYRDMQRIAQSLTPGYNDGTVQPARSYRYHIIAVDAAGNASAPSPASIIRTPAVPDTRAPTQPGKPRATSIAPHLVTLVWTASTDNVGVIGYDVFRDGDAIARSVTPRHADMTTLPGRSYQYRIVAVDRAGNASLPSPALVVRTPPGGDTQPPTQPRNLQAGVVGMSSIELRWSASSDNVGVHGYDIWRGTELAGSTTTTRFADTGLQPGRSYSYRVIARDAAGNSSTAAGPLQLSTLRDTVAPTVPAAVSASTINNGGFSLQWTASSDNVGVSAYEIQVGTRLITSHETSVTITGLAPNTDYPVQTRAVDAAGNRSAWSPLLTVRTTQDRASVSVNITLTATTVWGENIWLVGNRKELSDWDPQGGIPCTTTAATYPRWTCAPFDLPASTTVEYKFVKRKDKGGVIWEANQSGSSINRQLSTPASGSVNLDLSWR